MSDFHIVKSRQLEFYKDLSVVEKPRVHPNLAKKGFCKAETKIKQRRVQKQHQVPVRGLEWSHLAIHTGSLGSAPFVNMKTITQSTTIDHGLRSKLSDCASV